MSGISKIVGLSALALGLLPMAAAHAATDQQTLVDRARITIDDLHRDPAFGNAKDLMHRARGILIVPRLYKAGFFFGGEGGKGVLMVHNGSGAWSAPAFYTIGSASWGLQIGLEQSEMVIFLMTPRAVDAVMHDHFKIGADAGIAVATLGSNVEGAVTAGGPDLISWASSSGAYAGISINGSVIASNPDDNAAYYQRPISAQQIIRMSDHDPNGLALRQSLASVR